MLCVALSPVEYMKHIHCCLLFDWSLFLGSTLLVTLLKKITDCKVNGKKYRFRIRKTPKNEFECMDNIQVVLNYLAAKGVRIVNVGAGDIYHGNMKLTIGLIWTVIQAFQIDAKEAEVPEPLPGTTPQIVQASAKPGSGAQKLLRWCQGVTADYRNYGAKVRDFGASFSDGRALAAIIHAHGPDLIDLNALGSDPRQNLAYVMEVRIVTVTFILVTSWWLEFASASLLATLLH